MKLPWNPRIQLSVRLELQNSFDDRKCLYSSNSGSFRGSWKHIFAEGVINGCSLSKTCRGLYSVEAIKLFWSISISS